MNEDNNKAAPCPHCSAITCDFQYRYDFEAEQMYHAMINGDANLTYRTDNPACHIRPDWCPRVVEFMKNLKNKTTNGR